jgi:hypothetical protein
VILHGQIQKVGNSRKAASFGGFFIVALQITQRRGNDNARLGMGVCDDLRRRDALLNFP